MSVIITILACIVGGACVVIVGYAAVLAVAIGYFAWQEKRMWARHAKLRGEGF